MQQVQHRVCEVARRVAIGQIDVVAVLSFEHVRIEGVMRDSAGERKLSEAEGANRYQAGKQ